MIDGIDYVYAIKTYREKNKITQEELAKYLNVKRLTVLRWENNQAEMRNNVKEKIRGLLGLKQILICPFCKQRMKNGKE